MAKKSAPKKAKLTYDGFAKKITLRLEPNEVQHYDEIKKIFKRKQYTDAIHFAVVNTPSYIHENNFLKAELNHVKSLLYKITSSNNLKIDAEKRLNEAYDYAQKNMNYDPKKHKIQTSILDFDQQQ